MLAGLPPLLHHSSSRGRPLPCSLGVNVMPGNLFRWVCCVCYPLNKGKDPALGSDLTKETCTYLFSRLSVGQGLCCYLPCSWL